MTTTTASTTTSPACRRCCSPVCWSICELLVALAVASCVPEFADRPSRIDRPRLLAVRAVPAELRPGQAASYELFAVAPEGPLAELPARWAFCRQPRPAGEAGAVASICSREAQPLAGEAMRVTGRVPADACTLFGPQVRSGNFRPRDADATGGYYQPVRVEAAGALGFALQRITCAPANVPLEVARELQGSYQANQHPRIAALDVAGAVDPVAVAAGETVQVAVSWDPAAAESFVAIDPAAQQVVSRREAIRVSWLSNAGSFEREHSGRAEADLATDTDNRWTAPGEPGTAWLWAVLRDSRGGVDWRGVAVTVY